ncbi:hypothetical protein IKR55_01005 [bacterium]|nr:hypothetical protein [bacterium]
MKKKAIILTLMLLFASNTAFGFRAVTKAEHEAYLRSLGLNQTKIEQLKEIDLIYLNKRLEAQEKSRQYRKNNPTLTKDDYNHYTFTLWNQIEKDYRKDLGKVLNHWQKKRYLEYKSRVY